MGYSDDEGGERERERERGSDPSNNTNNPPLRTHPTMLIARVLRLLPRLCSLNVEVSIYENRHRALAWIFPRDAPFQLTSKIPSNRLDGHDGHTLDGLDGLGPSRPPSVKVVETTPEWHGYGTHSTDLSGL